MTHPRSKKSAAKPRKFGKSELPAKMKKAQKRNPKLVNPATGLPHKKDRED